MACRDDMADRKNNKKAESWSAYWSGAEAAIGPVTSGAKGEAFNRFWNTFFRERLSSNRQSMIDIACGAGPVSAQAAATAKSAGVALSVFSTDYSFAAVRGLLKASDGASVAGFAADAAVLPLPDENFDIAASQFGLEYAGPAAFDEAARIVRPGGVFAAVIHLKGGVIEEECAANLDIIVNTRKIEFLPRARDAFAAGFAALEGRGEREALQKADKAFAPSVKAAKKLLTTHPQGMARSFLERLYTDLAHMYPRMSAYTPEDIEAWISRGEFELKAYEHRMASMIAAAQSEKDIGALAEQLRGAGLVVAAPEILQAGDPLKPAAWALIAEKPI